MEKYINCPICESTLINCILSDFERFVEFNCPKCGKFKLSCGKFKLSNMTRLPKNLIAESNNAAIISYWLQNHQSKNLIYLTFDLINKIITSTTLPKPQEQADNLILWLGNNTKEYGKPIQINYSIIASVIGAVGENEVMYIIEHVAERNLVYNTFDSSMSFDGYLTFEGWERYNEFQRIHKDSRLAFMAMKFGDKTLDHIFNDIIKDAIDKAGFEIRKLDDVKRAGLIDDKLRVEIRRSKFLIADLTHDNNGAYWEAGYAEGLGIPVIYICEESKFKDKKTHFDTNHHLTLTWKDEEEPLNEFLEELKATIRETFPEDAKMED